MFQTTPWTLPIALIGGFAPVITGINYVMEKRFSARWGKRLAAAERNAPMVEEVAAA